MLNGSQDHVEHEMHDRAALDEQPPYWDDAEAMDFRELLKFYDRAWEALSDPDPDPDLPRTKEEFERLADLLDSKLDPQREALKNVPQLPSAPRDYMTPYFEPSNELEAAQDRLEWLQERFREETYNSPSSSSSIDNLRQKIRDQERVVAMREEGEREEYNKRYASYLEAQNEYEEKYRSWRKHAEEARKIQKRLESQSSFVEKRRRRINRAFKLGARVPTKQLYWRPLPPGNHSREGIRDYYAGIQAKNPGTQYDWERIEKALDLGPNLQMSYEEIRGSEGYIVFTFPHTTSVLLECPKVGNAVYIIHSDWERWSKMTKQELMADTSGEVVRIPHQGDWFGRVKRELGIEKLIPPSIL